MCIQCTPGYAYGLCCCVSSQSRHWWFVTAVAWEACNGRSVWSTVIMSWASVGSKLSIYMYECVDVNRKHNSKEQPTQRGWSDEQEGSSEVLLTASETQRDSDCSGTVGLLNTDTHEAVCDSTTYTAPRSGAIQRPVVAPGQRLSDVW